MRVLSLFDGISCARLALKNLQIDISEYYASEIDLHSILVSKSNFPDIIHVGDIRNINPDDYKDIDLLIGGSPCQDLSNAKIGEGLEGAKSGLFYEYLRIYKEIKPKYFLLENVKNKWGDRMSELLGVPYIEINSGLFSAQSRPRYYWTNIPNSKLPVNSSSQNLIDILVDGPEKELYLSKNGIFDFVKTVKFNENKTKDGLIKLFDIPREILRDNDRQRRVFSPKGKSPTLLARADTTKIFDGVGIRKLSPIECERLQGLPDNYTSSISNSQRYKSIGNGFTVSVIEFLLKGIIDKNISSRNIKTALQLNFLEA